MQTGQQKKCLIGPTVSTWVGKMGDSKTVAVLTLPLALLVLGGMVGLGALYLRDHLREHLVERDGDVLYTVAMARQYANGAGADLTKRLGAPATQLALALDISQMMDGVMGVRIFDPQGRFVTAVPPTVKEANLPASHLQRLRQLRPVSRFFKEVGLDDYFLVEQAAEAGEALPLLEVTIPLHARGETNLLAAAQLLLDGRETAVAYARIDTHLWWLALGLFSAGSVVLAGILAWAYRRLRAANLLLEGRTQQLLRANHELALAAKTSAVGSVTAHLIHGLSNPLANLQDFITAHGRNGGHTEDLESVAKATRRMQQLVHDVVRVLSEERGGENYQIDLADLVSVLNAKLGPVVSEAGVHFLTEIDAQAEMSNRQANLVLLILENLVHNAIKVSARGQAVRLRFSSAPEGLRCEVLDSGAGVPTEMLARLFTPCRSTHGGSGLGLALSRQLAGHLGAELQLHATSAAGSSFVLTLPKALFAEPKPSVRR